MILLPTQFQMIIYHFIMGWLLGLCFSIFNVINMTCLPHFQKLFEFLFFTIFTCIFYYFLYQLNGGITQLYCLILFALGIFIFMKFYLMTFNPFLFWLVKRLNFLQSKLRLAFSRVLGIIDIRAKIKKWRNSLGKHKQKSRNNHKKNSKKGIKKVR